MDLRAKAGTRCNADEGILECCHSAGHIASSNPSAQSNELLAHTTSPAEEAARGGGGTETDIFCEDFFRQCVIWWVDHSSSTLATVLDELSVSGI